MAATRHRGITSRELRDGVLAYDVRYRLPSGKHRMKTFRTITEARNFQASVRMSRSTGVVVDPQRGRIKLEAYASEWIDTRADLAPRTVELYRSLLRLHIAPELGGAPLARIQPEDVRRWHSQLKDGGVGATTMAKAYRLLRAMLNTAVADGRITVNPCQIERAGMEATTERPVATPSEVLALAGAMDKRGRAIVLLAGFCGLRLGEILGLAVRHVNLLHATVTIERQLQEVGSSHELVLREPKSAAGRRTVNLPAVVVTALTEHLEERDAGGEAFLFVGDRGGPLRRSVWHGYWSEARQKAKAIKGLRFHDLRHSALTLYAATGATIAELQAQAGHSSPAAAMRYQHATQSRADALTALVDKVIEADTETRSEENAR